MKTTALPIAAPAKEASLSNANFLSTNDNHQNPSTMNPSISLLANMLQAAGQQTPQTAIQSNWIQQLMLTLAVIMASVGALSLVFQVAGWVVSLMLIFSAVTLLVVRECVSLGCVDYGIHKLSLNHDEVEEGLQW